MNEKIPRKLQKQERVRDREDAEKQSIDDTRRFLVGSLASGIGLTALSRSIPFPSSKIGAHTEIEQEDLPFEPLIPDREDTQESAEKTHLATFEEQLEQFGRVENLEEALRAHEKEHRRYFTHTETGKHDLNVAVANMSKLDMRQLMKPFIDYRFPEDLGYMIAIQETRGRNLISSAGAQGITGIMPETARSFGEEPDVVHNPYVATKMAADFLKREVRAFGRNIPMLLHVYNGGAGLFGFTKSYPQEKWKPKYFYEYMQDYMNKKYVELKERGLGHKIVKGDTLHKIANEYSVSIDTLMKHNALDDGENIIAGRTLWIPLKDNEEILRIGFRKELELLQYVPEIRAKYSALKALDLVAVLEKGIKKHTSAFG